MSERSQRVQTSDLFGKVGCLKKNIGKMVGCLGVGCAYSLAHNDRQVDGSALGVQC